MPMHLEEQLRAPVSRTEAWAFLWQTERLAGCLPGCNRVEEVEPQRQYKVWFDDSIGPYKVHFQMDVSVVQMREPELIEILVTGQDRKLGATARTSLAVQLDEDGPAATLLRVTADVEITGKIATLGQFVIKRKVRDVVSKFAQNIQAELEARPAGAANA